MGGLTTPRFPAEIVGDKVVNIKGEDVTGFFKKGAEEALKIAKEKEPHLIILKAKSPSCGKGEIYDGSFSEKLINGNGITCQILLENGYKIITEKEI